MILIGLPKKSDVSGQLKVQGGIQIHDAHRAVEDAVEMRDPRRYPRNNIGSEIDDIPLVSALFGRIGAV